MPTSPLFVPSGLPGLPPGLHVLERAPADGWDGHRGPVVVLVHGSLDRATSFTRTLRRLPEDWGVFAYDRRGYQASRDGPPVGVAGHVDDLLGVARAANRPGWALTAIGHSMGGVVVMGAAVAEPALFASIGAYEPPTPWLPLPNPEPAGAPFAMVDDPERQAETFFRRMMGDAAWERLPAAAKASRLADGPALQAELTSLRLVAPFDVAALVVPTLLGFGGPASGTHRHQRMTWLADHIIDAHRFEAADAGHGAHLSHPAAFADFVRAAVALGQPTREAPTEHGSARR